MTLSRRLRLRGGTARALTLARRYLPRPRKEAARDTPVPDTAGRETTEASAAARTVVPSILDSYVRGAPSPQTAVDIFAGEWAARFPPPLEGLRAGSAPLFEVEHVQWGVHLLGGISGGRVLELGPLEGGHTYILDRLGASEIVAVEANTRAYLKCLVSKELLGIPAGRFLCGDFVSYLADLAARDAEKFDLCLASGVLYHLTDPVTALALMREASDRLILWTHYYNEELIASRADLAVKFPDRTVAERLGFRHTLYRQEYQGSLDHQGFCGGSAEASNWMSREDILGALDHVGYEVVAIGHEERDHKGHGSCFCVVARGRR